MARTSAPRRSWFGMRSVGPMAVATLSLLVLAAAAVGGQTTEETGPPTQPELADVTATTDITVVDQSSDADATPNLPTSSANPANTGGAPEADATEEPEPQFTVPELFGTRHFSTAISAVATPDAQAAVHAAWAFGWATWDLANTATIGVKLFNTDDPSLIDRADTHATETPAIRPDHFRWRTLDLLAKAGLCQLPVDSGTWPTNEAVANAVSAELADIASLGSLEPSEAGSSDCEATFGPYIPSMELPPHGAHELVAMERTAGTAISPLTYLSAAFELGMWRPAELHPRVIGTYRFLANQARTSAAGGPYTCNLSALRLTAEMAQREPRVPIVDDGLAIWADERTPLDDVAVAAAQDLCTNPTEAATLTAADVDAIHWAAMDADRWVLAAEVATAAGSVTAPQGVETDGNDGAGGRVDQHSDTAELASYRACDAVERAEPIEDALVTVRGISVHECLAEPLAALLTDALTSGIWMYGWGYRTVERQIQLRIQNCPLPRRSDPDFEEVLWTLTSEKCSPPTQIPDRSRHTFGHAIDFTCGSSDQAISSRSSRCYRWLAANAYRYGLYNLLSEPWHWSTTGT